MFMIIYFLYKHLNLNFKYKTIYRKINSEMDERMVG